MKSKRKELKIWKIVGKKDIKKLLMLEAFILLVQKDTSQEGLIIN